jgi:hypothetical protein
VASIPPRNRQVVWYRDPEKPLGVIAGKLHRRYNRHDDMLLPCD